MSTNPDSFDPRELRNAYGLFPTGVAIVTAFAEAGEHLGMTVSSFNTVSLDPPLILFSILNSAKGFSQWMATESFCVNFLGEDQSDVSTRFARALTDKWNEITWQHGEVADVPVLSNCMANLECSTWARYPGGDHTIIVGRIVGFQYRHAAHLRPLVFCGGKYRKIDSDVSATQTFEWLLGW